MKRNRLLSTGFHLLLYCLQCISIIQPIHSLERTSTSRDELHPVHYQGVQGKPGLDFPVLTSIPKTSFSCKDIETGYYADLETNCQVFHICDDGKKTSFLCPNGTIFQQSDLICDWWFKVNCTSSPLLYEESSEQLKEEMIKKKSARKITWKGSDKIRQETSNPRKDFVSTQNKYPTNDVSDEEKLAKASSKQNWSSVFNEPQWKINEGNKAKFIEDFDIRTSQEYLSTTEKFEGTSRNPNNIRKQISIRRKKPRDESKQIKLPSKSTSIKNQSKNDYNFDTRSSLRNEYVTTEENVMTVTPESTSKIITTKTTNRKRFQYKDSEKHYSTSYNKNRETTTASSRLYSSKRRIEPIISTSTPKYENQESEKSKRTGNNSAIDQNKYVNIFVGTRNKVIRTNNGRLSDSKKNAIKSYQKNKQEKSDNSRKTSSTTYLNNGSNVLSGDSEETQVPQETAYIVDNNIYNNFNRANTEKSTGFYENHKSEYSEIKDPNLYNEKYFNNIVPVTSQYVTTQAFNTGKTFVGSSVGTPILRNKTHISNINEHNRKTFKLSAIAFNTAQALNPFQNENQVTNTPPPNTGMSSDYNKPAHEPSTVAFNTVEPYNRNVEAESSTTKAVDDTTGQTFEFSTEAFDISALNPLNNINTKIFSFNYEPKEEIKKDILKHSTISLNTAQAYESLFNEETKSRLILNRDQETTTLLSPMSDKPTATVTLSSSTEAPFTSRRLEITTTAQEPEKDDLVDIRFNAATQPSRGDFTTESILSTSIPTKPPQAPLKPRPFELVSTESTYFGLRNEKSEKLDDLLPYPFFKISTASPFSLRDHSTQNEIDLRNTDSPTTEPTNFYIKTDEVSVNDDIQTQESSGSFRPGLIVPSSVSPQTLHSLATYFENALSNMTSEDRAKLGSNDDFDNSEMEEKLRVLLSNMTKQKYEQLFGQMTTNDEDKVENTTLTEINTDNTDTSEDPQKVRKLAKIFSQALSEYLHDPTNFKNRLIQVRPTEPPSHGNVFNTEKELLSFSEDDSKNTLASLYNSTSWNFKSLNDTNIQPEDNNNFIGSDGEGLTIADSQSFISQFNNLNYEDKQKVGVENLPKNHWTSSPQATHLWRTTFAVDPFSLNKDFQVTESYAAVTHATEAETTEHYSDIDSLASLEEKDIKYELRVFPKLSSNSSKLQGILIDFMNSSISSEGERLHRILRKLNTTEDEFLDRMKKIEENPLTKRLILLLIHECEATKNEKKELIPFLNPEKQNRDIFSSEPDAISNDDEPIDKDQDARALQLLNSLYNIATKFGR